MRDVYSSVLPPMTIQRLDHDSRHSNRWRGLRLIFAHTDRMAGGIRVSENDIEETWKLVPNGTVSRSDHEEKAGGRDPSR